MNEIINTTETLKPCPFCGSKANLVKSQIFMSDVFQVECSHCKCTTAFESYGQMTFPKIYITVKQAQQKAISKWNNRIEGRS